MSQLSVCCKIELEGGDLKELNLTNIFFDLKNEFDFENEQNRCINRKIMLWNKNCVLFGNALMV